MMSIVALMGTYITMSLTAPDVWWLAKCQVRWQLQWPRQTVGAVSVELVVTSMDTERMSMMRVWRLILMEQHR